MLIVKLPKKQLDGTVTAADLMLGVITPVTITGITFSTFARIVICQDVATRQRLISTYYQMMHVVPAGVLFECASNVIWQQFDLRKPPIKAEQQVWFRYPQKWKPVTVQSNTGVLPCMIEARAGTVKHKVTIEIVLNTIDDEKKTS